MTTEIISYCSFIEKEDFMLLYLYCSATNPGICFKNCVTPSLE